MNYIETALIKSYNKSECAPQTRVAKVVSRRARKQIGGTCYAHAIATAIRAAQNSSDMQQTPHLKILELLTDKYGHDGANIEKVLQDQCPVFGLGFSKLSSIEACEEAVEKEHAVIASFYLAEEEWDKFEDFYSTFPTKVLQKEDMKSLPSQSKKLGHAVVICGENRPQNYWKLKNSWGSKFGDNGGFRIAKDAVNFTYFELYKLEQDFRNGKRIPRLEHLEEFEIRGKKQKINEAPRKDWEHDSKGIHGTYRYPDGVYVGYRQNNLREGPGKMTYNDTSVYDGNWKNDKREGYGTLYANGDVYKGDFKNDKKEGKGEIVWANKHKYKGDFKNDLPDGQGTMTFAHGDIYTGGFKEGVRYGKGTYESSDGTILEGTFRNDDAHGYGEQTFTNGDTYKGQWQNDKREGYGILSETGDVYKGDFKNNKKEGKGKIVWADNDKYEGDFKNDLPDGQGTMTFAHGDIYTGGFKEGSRYGKGTYKSSDGTILEGTFRNDDAHGYGEQTFTNGDTYKGQWQNDKRHGFGILEYHDGSRYEGEFFNDQMEGKGKVVQADVTIEAEFKQNKYVGKVKKFYNDGRFYEGNVNLDGEEDGYGIMRYKNGDLYQGNFKTGKREGFGKITSNKVGHYEGQWQNDKPKVHFFK